MKRILLLSAILVLVLATPDAFGQKKEDDGPVGIFPTRAEYHQFMGNAKEAAYGEDGNAELQAMIPMLNDIALDKPMGWTANEYGTQGSDMGLLSDDSIRADIEMVVEQFEELKTRNAEIQRQAAEQIRALDFKDRENLVGRINDIRKKASNEMSSVLLPHQLERLKQIRMQSRLKHQSLVDILTSDPVKTDLEVTDEQSEELRKEEKMIEADLEKEIAKLREQAQKRLLSKLKPMQKSKVEKMLGDKFVFKPHNKKTSETKKKKRALKDK